MIYNYYLYCLAEILKPLDFFCMYFTGFYATGRHKMGHYSEIERKIKYDLIQKTQLASTFP